MTLNYKPRIAVIGGGVAGILTCYLLQNQADVTLFEKNNYVGGHTNTIVLTEGPDSGTPVDTGFIVLNNWTYPNFHHFLKKLQVPLRNSDMSFGYYCESSNLQYAGTTLNGLLAQRKNLFRPRFLQLIRDFLRFNYVAKQDLTEGNDLRLISLGTYLRKYRFSESFIQDYLIPVSSAIWSTARPEMLDFPTEVFLRFFQNHGLLNLFKRPQWQTVVGGSFTYVKAFLNQFSGTVQKNSKIREVARTPEKISVSLQTGETLDFDFVIFAVHADEVLKLLACPSEEEQRLFGVWKYQQNETILHTDTSIMPPNRRAWASWNVIREKNASYENPVSMTYDMNRLQGLRTQKRYLVSLNLQKRIDPRHILKEIQYTHPRFTLASLDSREKIKQLNGNHRTYFVGSYFGYGFHEDAVRSAVEMTQQHFGVSF
ncbi:MAG: FAD-dependent oxidoreductase [Planctomycetota bacterium]